jgi:hypothetical protein
MDNLSNPLVNPFPDSGARPEFNQPSSHRRLQIDDSRIVQLLLVLHAIDESVAEFGALSDSALSELVSSAILACGFVDPIEAWRAIAVILDAIEADHHFGGTLLDHIT